MSPLCPARTLSRRRVLSIFAAGSALALSGSHSSANSSAYRWEGIALGAKAEMSLYAVDQSEAANIIEEALREVARLESIFSLHQPDSALSRLNRAGVLDGPPVELIELISLSLTLAEKSNGRFDPSIQPLWTFLATYFSSTADQNIGPSVEQLMPVRQLVDWRAVNLAADRIKLERSGMQLTLNGIAQGYICDRIGDLLRSRGFLHTLINLGETRALGPREDGRPWRVGVMAPAGQRSEARQILELSDGAAATSAAGGLIFEPTGRFNHIIDPTRMRCADLDATITVTADSAAVADGLSTLGALTSYEPDDFRHILRRFEAKASIMSASSGEIRLLA